MHGDFNSYNDDSKLDYSMCGAITRLCALGMPLVDVICRATLNPAKILGEEDNIGTLASGTCADITFLESVNGQWELLDSENEALIVEERFVPSRVFRNGIEFEPTRRLLRDIWGPSNLLAAE